MFLKRQIACVWKKKHCLFWTKKRGRHLRWENILCCWKEKLLVFLKREYCLLWTKQCGRHFRWEAFCVFGKTSCLWFKKKESIVCFEPKGVGGIAGERTFCVFAKKKCVFLEKRKHCLLGTKRCGRNFRQDDIFVFLKRKIACALEKEALSVLNQTVWEAF